LMSAFCYYLDQDYTNSIQSAQRFLSVHPGNRDAPYAYYLIALDYYEQINDVTRDQKISQQALDSLGELTRRYPNSRYAADARLKIDLVRDHLAGKEMEIGRFYERRRQWLAATMRFRHVVDDYQTTTHTPEALMRLTETYLALGTPVEAERAAAVLGTNYPGTDWYKHAYDLMKEHGDQQLPPVPRGQPIIGNPAAAKPQGPPGTADEPANKVAKPAPDAPPPGVGTAGAEVGAPVGTGTTAGGPPS
jgi:outer membrane protein assembly factor BamD